MVIIPKTNKEGSSIFMKFIKIYAQWEAEKCKKKKMKK